MPGLHLTRTEENAAEIAALTADVLALGGERVGAAGALAALDRRLRRTFAPHPRLLGLKVSSAYTWETPDRRDQQWWPQGITTSAHTGIAAEHGHDVLATSWYAKPRGNVRAGSRISLVDVRRRRYDHVLLVLPTLSDGRPGLQPLRAHAGGIVWHGEHLHVAATGRGFFTCRTADLLRLPEHSPYETFGHRYVLPVRLAHRGGHPEGVERLRFSFFTLDRSGDQPSLLVGEYGSPRQTRRFARFALDPTSGLPVLDESGRAVAEVDDRGVTRMQGVAVIGDDVRAGEAGGGTYFLTRSRGPKPGSAYVGRPGAFREHRWATPPGPEDLVWWPETGALWSVTEHPHLRWVFAMRPDSLR
ncbi:hypothetical protein KG112_12650 [Nocardioides sp. zg-ZUI104]|uniref:hypothetical protein n=1 Tax=Nocardioides faecalis TaxID=2803858 RepID=UPI001BCD61A6|nr:hypothetical protein [Nocardioides faecalis]MBS4753657.1 hypothetical protein [Nocardioides faecalis]